MVTSSTRAPQGTVLAPLPFSLHTTDFMHNTEMCHGQKLSDNTQRCNRGSYGGDKALVKDLLESPESPEAQCKILNVFHAQSLNSALCIMWEGKGRERYIVGSGWRLCIPLH